jgi:hypothetical protein
VAAAVALTAETTNNDSLINIAETKLEQLQKWGCSFCLIPGPSPEWRRVTVSETAVQFDDE